MLFSSSVFIFLFLPICLLGFHMLSRFGRVPVFSWLAFMSLFFYAYWNPKFLILLVVSVLLNFAFSRLIATGREKRQGVWLVLAIAANLLLLIYFKYLFPLLGFFHESGLVSRDFGSVILPLGISFFTFTQIAYLIDLKQGVAEPQDLLSYTLFVTFFPHLIAGPIVHHSEMMPQFARQKGQGLRADDVTVGLSWFVLGLAKKVLIADRVSPVADLLYNNPHSFGLAGTWLGVLAYAVQLYFDFSGYSDMALGLARMFSIDFPLNFNSPFKAANIIDFWQRWHMTLTRYLNLYLYSPMALAINRRRVAQGKKVSKKATRTLEGFTQLIAFPTLVTMFLAGVWHGAGLHYILFGLVHAVYLTVNHAWRVFVKDESLWKKLLPTPLSVAVTFAAVVVGQIFFRANTSVDAFYVIGTMLGLHGLGPAFASNPMVAGITSTSAFLRHLRPGFAVVTACLVVTWVLPNTHEILGQIPIGFRRNLSALTIQWRPNFVWAASLGVVFLSVVLLLEASTSFLYFQF